MINGIVANSDYDTNNLSGFSKIASRPFTGGSTYTFVMSYFVNSANYTGYSFKGIITPGFVNLVKFGDATTNSSNIGGTGPLCKVGLGTLVLSGTNNYTGSTEIAEGALSISSLNNIGSVKTVTFIGASTLVTTANLTLTSVVKTAAATFNVPTSSALTLTALTGAANMAVTGTDGTSIVSVASALPTGAGNYTVSSGVLRIADIAATAGATGTVEIQNGGILDCATNTVLAADRFPSGTLTLRGGGALKLGIGTFLKNIVLG